jgi:hypothetical protein
VAERLDVFVGAIAHFLCPRPEFLDSVRVDALSGENWLDHTAR